MRLTKTKCESYKAKNKQYKVSDGDCLYLLIKPNAAKYWRMNYRFGGKSKTLAIGVFPETSLKEARLKRDEAKKLLSDGKDPTLEKQKNRMLERISSEATFQSVATEWLNALEERSSIKHFKRTKSLLEKDIFPALGNYPLNEVSSPLLLIALRKIEARGAIESAHKALSACGKVIRYAIATGQIDRDVTHGLKGALKTHKVKHHAYVKEHELSDFFKRLKTFDGNPITALGLEFLILTMVRTQEARYASWPEFILDRDLWRIPEERMKKERPHLVPLSRQAKGILQNIKNLTEGSELLFPSSRISSQPISENTFLYALYRMGYHGRATVHGFRATASTILYENRFREDVIEKQLSHEEGNKVKAAYNHAQYLEERTEMMQWWADHLDKFRP